MTTKCRTGWTTVKRRSEPRWSSFGAGARWIARNVTPPIVVRLMRRLRKAGRPTRTALGGLDDLVEPYIDTVHGYYVELGANDGITQSNTYWLERERGWSGLLIEPALNRYFELRRNRSPKNSFACAACVPFDYTDKFVLLRYSNLMTVAPDIGGDLPNVEAHLAAGERFLRPHEECVSFGAIARTLQSLLEDAGAPAVIDLLSLDVEGAELPVLRGIDHSRTRFRLLLVESREIAPVQQFLAAHGYSLEARLTHHDFLFTCDDDAR